MKNSTVRKFCLTTLILLMLFAAAPNAFAREYMYFRLIGSELAFVGGHFETSRYRVFNAYPYGDPFLTGIQKDYLMEGGGKELAVLRDLSPKAGVLYCEDELIYVKDYKTIVVVSARGKKKRYPITKEDVNTAKIVPCQLIAATDDAILFYDEAYSYGKRIYRLERKTRKFRQIWKASKKITYCRWETFDDTYVYGFIARETKDAGSKETTVLQQMARINMKTGKCEILIKDNYLQLWKSESVIYPVIKKKNIYRIYQLNKDKTTKSVYKLTSKNFCRDDMYWDEGDRTYLQNGPVHYVDPDAIVYLTTDGSLMIWLRKQKKSIKLQKYNKKSLYFNYYNYSKAYSRIGNNLYIAAQTSQYCLVFRLSLKTGKIKTVFKHKIKEKEAEEIGWFGVEFLDKAKLIVGYYDERAFALRRARY